MKNEKKEEEKKPLTIKERIEILRQQGEKSEQQMLKCKEIATKCQGAIEVLEVMLEEETKQTEKTT